jgi:hypothetical protein
LAVGSKGTLKLATGPEIPDIAASGGEETDYLLKSDVMKHRLLEARDRKEGLSIETAVEKLGI